MKIYFVVKEPSERTVNHYVESLGMALQKQGCEVVYGRQRLWTAEVQECDIVHFQWPEFIFRPCTESDVARMTNRLECLRAHGIRIFCTCHNLKPHSRKDDTIRQLYDVLYNHADTIVHLGQYSCELLRTQYPNARHVVMPHHIYNNVLTFAVSQQEARQRLHLPQDKKIILCFGKFRNNQERNFVLNLKIQCNHSPLFGRGAGGEALFLMPGFYRETLHTWNPKKFVNRLYHTLRYKLMGIHFSNEVIPDDLMQCYYCAADVVLIQRLDILNSGNLPMAFAAGRVVVGPDVGNVGQILRETGNFTFDPQQAESAVEALHAALRTSSKGEENKVYAAKHWSTEMTAKKMLEYYETN